MVSEVPLHLCCFLSSGLCFPCLSNCSSLLIGLLPSLACATCRPRPFSSPHWTPWLPTPLHGPKDSMCLAWPCFFVWAVLTWCSSGIPPRSSAVSLATLPDHSLARSCSILQVLAQTSPPPGSSPCRCPLQTGFASFLYTSQHLLLSPTYTDCTALVAEATSILAAVELSEVPSPHSRPAERPCLTGRHARCFWLRRCEQKVLGLKGPTRPGWCGCWLGVVLCTKRLLV